MKDFDLVSGHIHRGLGVIARWPGIVLVIPSDAVHDQAVDRMIGQLGYEPAPAEVAQAVNDLIHTEGILRSAGYLVTATGGPIAMAYGPVEILADGEVVVAGRNGPAEAQVSASAAKLTIRASNLSKAAEPVVPFDLRRGVVPGAGITLSGAAEEASTELTAPPRPLAAGTDRAETAVEPAEIVAPFRSVLLFGRAFPNDYHEPLPLAGPSVAGAHDVTAEPQPVPARPLGHPAPSHRGHQPTAATVAVQSAAMMVQGIICSRQHFNNPEAAYCMVCGISMVHVTHNLVPGPRPTLGFMVFDDGSTFGLDRGYVVGREPGEASDPHTAPLTIQDNNETLSRRHAEVRLIEWTVHIVDLGSTNGTFIWDINYERWNQIPPNHPMPLSPGDTVALGRRTFVYESVTRL